MKVTPSFHYNNPDSDFILCKFHLFKSWLSHLNKFNQFNGDIKFLNEEDNKEFIRKEIFSIVSNLVTYVSAKEDGQNIEIWERLYQPIIFNE